MYKSYYFIVPAIIAMLGFPMAAAAGPDQYAGDSSIYGVVASEIQPNILFILDTSGSMNDETLPGDPYDPLITYPLTTGQCGGQPCSTNVVYKCTAFGQECGNWTSTVSDVNLVTTSCGGSNPRNSLMTTGQWNSGAKRLTTAGACANGNGIYATGNWSNWRGQAGTPTPKIDIAKNVIKDLLNSTTGVRIGLMIFNGSHGGVLASRLVSGSTYTAAIKDMDAIHTGTITNRQALISVVDGLVADSWTPLAETLFEGMRYYSGGASAFTTGLTYTTPITASCQKNYIVLITDGMSTQDQNSVLTTICTTGQGYPENGDCDRDGFEPDDDPAKSYPNSGSDYMDDVAMYLRKTDMTTLYNDDQTVVTYTVGFGLGGSNAGAVKLLQETAANGGGQAFLSNDAGQLTSALTQILARIFEANTSFVAPVVPVSPENRTYSGSRIYMGFFKPITGQYWNGNLKKYGLNNRLRIVDKNDNYASYVDMDRDGIDDTTSEALPAGATNGTFRDTSTSFWSTIPDKGDVQAGGIGEMLLNRTAARSIYTYTGTNTSLIHSSNLFAAANAAITPALLGVAADADKIKLIDFMHGIDAYDEDLDTNKTEKRGWLIGDVLHSRPQVVNYASYDFSTSNESNCAVNKTMIYVGSNDGMIHAIRDCDGTEAWAFIPPNLLNRLQNILTSTHTYFVDGSPAVYIYDADKDGNIESGDKVIMVFGLRRGGGIGPDTPPTQGYYYALDISDPENPFYLWKKSSADAEFTEMGEAWSEPKIAKIRYGSTDKIVAFIAAGYDNLNEDSRYGATQQFLGTGVIDNSDPGDGAVTSAGTAGQRTPTGRGLFAIEVASLSTAGVPSFSTSGTKIWGYTQTDNPTGMTFPLISEITAIDSTYDGYADKLYVGDSGGNIWRINIANPSTSSWTVHKIFSSNPGADGSRGRKIFYKPAAALEPGSVWLYFGTGDREHPLNKNVVDRMYSLIDRGQTTPKTEADLVDLTLNLLQAGTETDVTSTFAALNDPNKYGWYIKLDEIAGEKALSPAIVFNETAYFTTFAPSSGVVLDPCLPGNLGGGRAYAVHYKTGEAVINYDPSNDSTPPPNPRAGSGSGPVLLRSDRVVTLGDGIPSGIVIVVGATGDASALVGTGGSIATIEIETTDLLKHIYWRQK